MRQQLSIWLQNVILFLMSVSFIIICFYPGTLNNDSEWQLAQAKDNIYFDGHPPIMSYLWHILNKCFPSLQDSGSNLFLFNAICFCSALLLITTANQKLQKQRFLLMVLSLIFLPMLCIIGFIIKDALMAVMLLLFYALMLNAEQKKSKILWLLAIIPLFIAFSTRYNAVFAVIPFAMWYVYLLLNFTKLKFKTSIQFLIMALLSFLLFIVFFFTKNILETKIIHANKSFAAQFLLAYDLVGVSVRADENILPKFYTKNNAPITMDLLEKMYRPYSNYYVFWGDTTGETTLAMVADKLQENALIFQWFRALKQHPKAMIAHKIEIYFSALGLAHQYYQLKANELYSAIGIPWNKIVPTIAMDGWIYLLLLFFFILFPYQLQNHQKILLWSGFLYGLSWVLITPNAEQRYFFWVMMSATILAINQLINYILKIFKVKTK